MGNNRLYKAERTKGNENGAVVTARTRLLIARVKFDRLYQRNREFRRTHSS